jgi:hypothetical protein
MQLDVHGEYEAEAAKLRVAPFADTAMATQQRALEADQSHLLTAGIYARPLQGHADSEMGRSVYPLDSFTEVARFFNLPSQGSLNKLTQR